MKRVLFLIVSFVTLFTTNLFAGGARFNCRMYMKFLSIIFFVTLLTFFSCSTQKPLIDFGGDRDYEAVVYQSLDKFPKSKIERINLVANSVIEFSGDEASAMISFSQKNWVIKKVTDFNFKKITLTVEQLKFYQNGTSAPYIIFRYIGKSGKEMIVKPTSKVEKTSDSFLTGQKYKLSYEYDFNSIKEVGGELYLQSLSHEPPSIVAIIKNAKCTYMIGVNMYDTKACNIGIKSSYEVSIKVSSIN